MASLDLSLYHHSFYSPFFLEATLFSSATFFVAFGCSFFAGGPEVCFPGWRIRFLDLGKINLRLAYFDNILFQHYYFATTTSSSSEEFSLSVSLFSLSSDSLSSDTLILNYSQIKIWMIDQK